MSTAPQTNLYKTKDAPFLNALALTFPGIRRSEPAQNIHDDRLPQQQQQQHRLMLLDQGSLLLSVHQLCSSSKFTHITTMHYCYKHSMILPQQEFCFMWENLLTPPSLYIYNCECHSCSQGRMRTALLMALLGKLQLKPHRTAVPLPLCPGSAVRA